MAAKKTDYEVVKGEWYPGDDAGVAKSHADKYYSVGETVKAVSDKPAVVWALQQGVIKEV